MIIVLPWPPKELTPNFKRRSHWTAYRQHTKDYRAACWALTLNDAGTGRKDIPEPLPMVVLFCPPDRRHRDDDGMVGAFKAGRDGIADALGIDDRHFRPTYRVGEPVKGGCVVVTIPALSKTKETEQ